MFTSLPHHLKTINDTVMGGQSSSVVQLRNQGIRFRGEVSLANKGGFASMRSIWPWLNSPSSIQEGHAIKINVKGDGQRYQFRLFTADNNDGTAYVYKFETTPDQTCTIEMPLTGFTARFRGQPAEKPRLDLKNILEYGLLIGDQQAGRFDLLLESLSIMD